MRAGFVFTFALAALVALAAGGCSVVRPRVQIDDTPAEPVVPTVAVAPSNGSLFHAESYRPLFEEYRARVAGDALTISIAEKVSASAKSNSTIAKNGALDTGLSAFPGVKANSFTGGRASATGTMKNSFDGKGETESSNDFSGTITVIVRQVLPNGHLLIAGEKQIGVNDAVDVLRFTGQVDPRAIQPGNTVVSTQVANVRLEHRGRGQAAEAQAMGWLGRVFMTVMPL